MAARSPSRAHSGTYFTQGELSRFDNSKNVKMIVLISPPVSTPRLRSIQNGHANQFFSFVSEEDALVFHKFGLGGLLGSLQADVEDIRRTPTTFRDFGSLVPPCHRIAWT